MKKTILLSIALLFLFCYSFATTRYVSTTGNDVPENGSFEEPYATITYAISQAEENDIIHILGTITEHKIQINKSLTIQGDNPASSIIQGAEKTPAERFADNEEPVANDRIFTISTPTVEDHFIEIKNLTIRNGFDANSGGAIYNNKLNSYLTIDNCNIINCYGGQQGGAVYTNRDLELKNSSFVGNSTISHGSCVALNAPAMVYTIENCLFYGNNTYGSGNTGAVRSNSKNITFINNTFAYNTVEVANKARAINILAAAGTEENKNIVVMHNNLFFNNVLANDDRTEGEDIMFSNEATTDFTVTGNIISYIHAATDRAPFENGLNFLHKEQVNKEALKLGELQQAPNGLYVLPVYPTSLADNNGSENGSVEDALGETKLNNDIGHIGVGSVTLAPKFVTDQYQNYPENKEKLVLELLSAHENVQFSISGGEDQTFFQINDNGELSFITPPSLDRPEDNDGDNTYKVEVTITADEFTVSRLFELSIVGAKLNVVMIVLDDLNDYIGFMGGHLQTQTPNIDRLASQGVTFMNAHSNAPLCDPSRASFLNGILPMTSQHFGTGNSNWKNNTVLKESKLISEYFSDNGYTTYKTGKITHSTSGENAWWDFVHENSHDYGPLAYNGNGAATHQNSIHQMADVGGALDGVYGRLSEIPKVRTHASLVDAPRYFEGWYSTTSNEAFRYISREDRDLMPDEKNVAWTAANIAALDEVNSEDPFFMAVGIIRPHSPFVVPDEYFDMFPLEDIVLPEIYLDDREDFDYERTSRGHEIVDALEHSHIDKNEGLKKYFQAYLASVAFADAMVGQVMDAVENSEYADNTVIMLYSDHGYLMGEKDYAHKNNLWEHSTRVPLIIKSPLHNATRGQEVEHPVSLINVYPTLKDLCYLTGDTKHSELGADLDGHSLKPFLYDVNANDYEGDEVAISTIGNWFFKTTDRQNYGIKSKRFRYIKRYDKKDELYDHLYDQDEYINVIDEPAYAEVKVAFEEKLDIKLRPNSIVDDELGNFDLAYEQSENWKTYSKTWGVPYDNDNTLIQRREEGDVFITYEVENPGSISFETWAPLVTDEDGKKVIQNFGTWKVYSSTDNVSWSEVLLNEIIGNYSWDSNILTYENLDAFANDTRYIKVVLEGNGDDHLAASIGKIRIFDASDRNFDMLLDDLVVSPDESIFEINPYKIRTSEAIMPNIADDFSEYGRYLSKSGNTYLTSDEGHDFHEDGERFVKNNEEDAFVIYEVNAIGALRIEAIELHSGTTEAINDTTLKDAEINVYISSDNENYTPIELRSVSLKINDIINNRGEENESIDEWKHSHKFALVSNHPIPEGTKYVKIELKAENSWPIQIGGVYFYSNYLISGSAPQVVNKADQTISIESISDKLTTALPFEIVASTTSGLDLSYAISGPASLEGTLITLSGEAGTVTVTVTQAGNEAYNSAEESISFLVSQEEVEEEKVDQTISIESISDKLTTALPFEIVASTTSGLDLSYAISGPASLEGTLITLSGEAGTVTVTVTQAGNEVYNAASKEVSFEVEMPEKVDQTISIESISDKMTTALPFEIVASTTSGLDLSYAIAGPASLEGILITLSGEAGTVTVTVTQAGNEVYNSAEESISFEVLGVDEPTSIDTSRSRISLYPNPASNTLNIKGLDQIEEVVIMNIIGQDVLSVKTQKTIDISTLKKGVYFIKFEKLGSFRFIKN